MMPTDEQQLSEAVASANDPLIIRGGGSQKMDRNLDGEPLSVSKITGVTLYEPGALTVVARAGTPLSTINDLLDAQGQRLAFEPMDLRGLLATGGTPTIGSVVAANLSGPRRIQVGACRDFLLGVRFVDGTGRIIKNGGRVMKNVTGYDVSKLMAGSFGTLGVLSEVALKVLPKPETNATLFLPGLSGRTAVAAMSAALGSPYDVSGVAHFCGPSAGTVIRLEGFEKSVKYRIEALSKLLSQFGEVQAQSNGESTKIWDSVRNVEPFHAASGDVWRISVAPSDAPELAAKIPADDLLFDWGGGLIWALVAAGTDIRRNLGPFQGHARLVRAADITTISMFHPEPPAVARISAQIRAKYDPRNILNRGLMA